MSEKNRPELEVQTGELAGRRFAVGEGCLRLGRASSNDIRVPDEELSRNHCLFEPSGESGIRMIDLASANGSFVNGEQVGGSPVELNPGDVLRVGSTCILVVGEESPVPPPAASAASASAPAAPVEDGCGGTRPSRKRGPLAFFLWAIAVAIVGLTSWLLARNPVSPTPGSVAEVPVRDVSGSGQIVELTYEKVVADSARIFRYQMDLLPDGTLKISVDDVPEANRHIVKSSRLGCEALGRIREIFSDPELQTLDREYAGPAEEPPRLESCTVKVVFAHRVRVVRVINTPEPEAFRRMRERLEDFAGRELGIPAIPDSADSSDPVATDGAKGGVL